MEGERHKRVRDRERGRGRDRAYERDMREFGSASGGSGLVFSGLELYARV